MNSAPESDSGRHPTTLLFNHYLPLELLEYFIIHGSRWMRNGLKYIKLIIRWERRAWLLLCVRVIHRIFARWWDQRFSQKWDLCLCRSYSVLTVCITSSLQNRANQFFSLTIPSHDHTGLRLYRFPRQFHPKGTLLWANKVLYKRRYQD
jgi:hypothetical protein